MSVSGCLSRSVMALSGHVATSKTKLCTVDDVHGMTYACCKYLRFEIVVVINLSDFGNQLQTIGAHIVKSSNKW